MDKYNLNDNSRHIDAKAHLAQLRTSWITFKDNPSVNSFLTVFSLFELIYNKWLALFTILFIVLAYAIPNLLTGILLFFVVLRGCLFLLYWIKNGNWFRGITMIIVLLSAIYFYISDIFFR
jgi:hypothetical protein